MEANKIDFLNGKDRYIVGSRNSELALVQSKLAIEKLRIETGNKIDFTIKTIKTTADKNLKTPLSNFKETGVFTKELDSALLEGKIDFSVHSLKDIETEIDERICIAAFLKRGSVEDALVFSDGSKHEHVFSKTKSLPINFVLGTSSVRRKAFLKREFPSVRVLDIRGNLNTRINLLNSRKTSYEGLVLASAGLERLNKSDLVVNKLNLEKFPPAVSQGAIAVTCLRKNNRLLNMLEMIDDLRTRLCCLAERELLNKLGGGCKIPLGAHTKINEDKEGVSIEIFASVCSPDGETRLDESKVIKIDKSLLDRKRILEAEKVFLSLGSQTAEALLKRGAARILLKK